MKVFADTSALIKLYVDEPGRDVVVAKVAAADELVVSSIAVVEGHSAIVRRLKAGQISPEAYEEMRRELHEDLRDAGWVKASDKLLVRAAALVEHTGLRSLDAIQLASALACKPDLVLCADSRLTEAARGEGLEVLVPE